MQLRACTDLRGQRCDLVVGQGQPAQLHWQRPGRHAANLIGLEANHAQLRALAQHRGQFGETVVRAKQNAQALQARQRVRQRTQLVAAQVQNLQVLGELEQFVGKFAQAAAQADPLQPGQRAAAQLLQCVHGDRRQGLEQLHVTDVRGLVVKLATRHQRGIAADLVAAVFLGVVHRLVGALKGAAGRIAGADF